MNLHLVIKKVFISFCLLSGCLSFSQEDSDKEYEAEEKSSILSSVERQKYFGFSIGYQNPISTGNNFIGSAYSGSSGYDLKIKLYVYKQFFMEYNNSISYFKVENKELVGNYNKSRIENNFLYIGYEFLPAPGFRLGINAALFGESDIINSDFNLGEGIQRDSGTMSSYGLYLTYEIQSHVAFYVDYSFRRIKTNINAPQELDSFFKTGSYNTIGFGIMFLLGKRDLVSRFIDQKN
ncbi:hypothetical protein [Winogradskyella sp. 4-2091]|uniref:hypothetical protein n=1 Tax=Winogradskyella sp. 4-2091 TaxID=3381659 RepID=UPI003891AB0C